MDGRAHGTLCCMGRAVEWLAAAESLRKERLHTPSLHMHHSRVGFMGAGSRLVGSKLQRTRDEDVAQVPGVWQRGGPHAVLAQRDHGAVVEHGQQHDEQRGEVPAHASRRACLAASTRSVQSGDPWVRTCSIPGSRQALLAAAKYSTTRSDMCMQ